MNAIKRTLAIVAVLTFTLGALGGQAGSRNDGSRRIRIDKTSVLLGSTVRPGWYTLSWTRELGTENVKIEIAEGKTVVAAGKGYWTESAKPWPYEALVYRGDGEVLELSEIRFRQSAASIRVSNDEERADVR